MNDSFAHKPDGSLVTLRRLNLPLTLVVARRQQDSQRNKAGSKIRSNLRWRKVCSSKEQLFSKFHARLCKQNFVTFVLPVFLIGL